MEASIVKEINFQMVKGARKNDLLESGGYLFVKNKNITAGVSFSCLKKPKCKVIVHKVVSGTFQFGDHTHAPDSERVAKRQIVEQGKDLARQSRTMATKDIISTLEAKCVEQQYDSSILGPQPNLKKILNVTRRKEHGVSNIGDSLLDLEVPQNLRVTLADKDFLLYDNKTTCTPGNRILIFSTVENLDKLSYCETWLLDGTFKSCPSLFMQLYTIHGIYGTKTAVPLVYAYLPGKSESVYREFLNVIERKTVGSPKFMILDFELAAINVCRDVFPGAQVRGCLFHCSQSISRKVKTIQDVNRRYMTNDQDGAKVKNAIRSLGALAFLPPAEVSDAFIEIRNQFAIGDSIREVFRYFSDNYIGDTWDTVTYPVEFWNVYDRYKVGAPRTNNQKEGWHCRFNSQNSRAHPDMVNSIEVIRREQQHWEGVMANIQVGHVRGRKKRSVQVEDRLRTIMENRDLQVYNNNLEFLSAVQRCLHEFIDV